MFGLTLEKLLLIGVIAVVLVGPKRLPEYAERLAEWARRFRSLLDTARLQAEVELGVTLDRKEWEAKVREYDPRRIVQEALRESEAEPRADAAEVPAAATATSAAAASASETATLIAPSETLKAVEASEAATTTLPRPHRWVVAGGTSGHPRRVRVPSAATERDQRTDSASGTGSHL